MTPTASHPACRLAGATRSSATPRSHGAGDPQLVVTNLTVASAMLDCLRAVTEQGSVPYSEVYLDVVHNAARSRSWFRVPVGAR